MDLYGLEQAMASSHYEITAAKQQSPISVFKMKSKAFSAMDELEGWCSKEKASVLIDFVLMIKPKIAVEIGVYGGKSLVPIAYALQESGGKIYGIDPWSAGESAIGMDGVNLDFWGNLDHEAIYSHLVKKIKKFGLESTVSLIRKTSESAAPIQNIDMIHIDGNHSEETSLIDVTKWVPLVRSGGIIIFDDVNWVTTNAATKWLDENCIKFATFEGDNIWGVWVKP